MKIINVYHSIDLDGQMSAAVVKHWFNNKIDRRYCSVCEHTLPDDWVGSTPCCGGMTTTDVDTIDFIGYNYGDPIPDLSKYDKVIMCDVSFPKDVMRELRRDKFDFAIGKDNLIFIDHHISAIKDSELEFYSDCSGLRDTKYSACELTWNYFFPNETMPEIVRLLGRYDCFGHKNTSEEELVLEFQYGARQKIANFEEAYEWLTMCIDHPEIVNEIQNAGSEIYQYLCTEAKQTYKNGFEIELKEYRSDINLDPWDDTKGTNVIRKFICINKERFNPINFGIDYHKDGYDGCACFHYANGMWNFSLYNDNGKVDCSAIAKQYLGGGHRLASGFRVEDKEFLKIINNGKRS